MMKLVKNFGMVSILSALVASSAMAEEVAHAATTGGVDLKGLGVALALGLAAFGGALGQAKIGTAAMDGIARNPAAQPKMFVPMIIGLALIESLVLYAFVIAFLKI